MLKFNFQKNFQLHMSSLTVFSNWPTRKGTFGYIQSLAFSPQSGYLAIGNDAGKALLFRYEEDITLLKKEALVPAHLKYVLNTC